jgi:hypothetical protein
MIRSSHSCVNRLSRSQHARSETGTDASCEVDRDTGCVSIALQTRSLGGLPSGRGAALARSLAPSQGERVCRRAASDQRIGMTM